MNRLDWEFLILDSDPSKYLVYLLCRPPNSEGERLPSSVNLLTRIDDGHEVITQEELTAIHTRIGEMLHITGSGVVPVKLAKDCWSNHADHWFLYLIVNIIKYLVWIWFHPDLIVLEIALTR
jgi:hypothetical protein